MLSAFPEPTVLCILLAIISTSVLWIISYATLCTHSPCHFSGLHYLLYSMHTLVLYELVAPLGLGKDILTSHLQAKQNFQKRTTSCTFTIILSPKLRARKYNCNIWNKNPSKI